MNAHVLATILWIRHRLRQRDHWTRQQLAAHQTQALRSLREYAYTPSPFYARFHQGLTDRPLDKLPVLTKSLMNSTVLYRKAPTATRC